MIDEFPYLALVSPELPSILQRFIDRELKDAKLIIVLCGSSQHMMLDTVIKASAPLYGRADEIIKLGPISIGYLPKAISFQSPREVIESYAIWGGIPRYWELVKNSKKPLLEAIDSLVLDSMGPLNEEPTRLLLEEIRPAITLRPILDAIGLGAHRLSEIAARVGTSATSLTRPIQRLIDLDFLAREVPFGCHEHHSKRTLYKIIDPFIRFWFNIVASHRSYFAQASSERRKQWLEDHLQPVFSLSWEELCRNVIPLLDSDQFLYDRASRYWDRKGPEWDVIAQSIDGKALWIGEAKWIAKKPSTKWVYQAIQDLKGKGLPPIDDREVKQIFYSLFIPEKPTGLVLPDNVSIFDAKAIIRAFEKQGK